MLEGASIVIFSHPIVKIRHSVCYMYGVRKKTNDATKFSYHFLLSDAQPDFSGTFHQGFSHIAQA